MNFFKIISKKEFYNDLKLFAENLYFNKYVNKESLNHKFFEGNDVLSETYEEILKNYESNPEKYNQINEETLKIWFKHAMKTNMIDDNRKKFTRTISTDKILSNDEKKKLSEKLNFKFENINTNARIINDLSNEIEISGKSSNSFVYNFKNYNDYYDVRIEVSKVLNSKKLSKKCIDILKLAIEEYSYEEIAKKIKISKSLVKNRLSNCRQEAALLLRV